MKEGSDDVRRQRMAIERLGFKVVEAAMPSPSSCSRRLLRTKHCAAGALFQACCGSLECRAILCSLLDGLECAQLPPSDGSLACTGRA
jgi:hypothetical protein